MLTYCTWRRFIIFPPSKFSDSCNITPLPIKVFSACVRVCCPDHILRNYLSLNLNILCILKYDCFYFLFQIICKASCWVSFITFIGLIMLVGQEICVYRNVCFGIIINIIVWDTSGLIERIFSTNARRFSAFPVDLYFLPRTWESKMLSLLSLQNYS